LRITSVLADIVVSIYIKILQELIK